ncbi:hypothetical protein WUBG_12222, partial [Wuchereria bancrofti]
VPNVNDIIFDVPLDVNFMENNTKNDGDGNVRKIRNVNDVNNDLFQPLRIHLHYDKISID